MKHHQPQAHSRSGQKPALNGASGGTRTHNLRFTKPELCQLSYASNLAALSQAAHDNDPRFPCK